MNSTSTPEHPTFVSTPSDLVYIEGTTGHALSWTATDDNPDIYDVLRDDILVSTGTWTNLEILSINVDGLSAGIYNYTIIVEDDDDYTATDSVNVTVYQAPIITETPYIVYKINTTGHELQWTAIDDNPTTYTISQNGSQVDSGSWTSDVPVNLSIDGLELGFYEYSVLFNDGDGYSDSDSYIVHVMEIYNYGEALQKSVYFYMQQRSGVLPDDNPVIWRGDSALNDGEDWGVNLTGGYYDAGDNVKYNLPMANTLATLAWSIYEFNSTFIAIDQINETLDAIKWGTDYLLKCHTAPDEYFFQVAWGQTDHDIWAPAEMVDKLYVREAFKANMTQGATTPVAAAAAALAFASIIFENINSTYADECLLHAEQLYDFAYAYQNDTYYNATAKEYLSYSGYWDELAAAGAILYLKTLDTTYLNESEIALRNANTNDRPWTHVWDQMDYMTYILLAQITANQTYIDFVESYLDWWLPTGGIDYTPGGLAWLDQWGSLRYSANTAFLASIWATDPLASPDKVSEYLTFAERQIDYALGDNPKNQSYMCGFGVNYPKNPHHRTAHGSYAGAISVPEDNQHILYGALVGGPGLDDSYEDDRTDYQKNEVACDYNSGLVGALAFLTGLYEDNVSILADFPNNYFTPEEERLAEMFALGKLDIDRDPRGEILENGDFSSDLDSWGISDWSPAVFDMSVVSDELLVDITDNQNPSGDFDYYVQLTQGPLLIEKGFTYTVSFYARAVAPRIIEVSVGQSGGSYTRFGSEEIALTTTLTKYNFSFIMTYDTELSARIEFNLAQSDINLYLSEVSIIESAQVNLIEYEGELLENGDFSDGFNSWAASTWSSADFSVDAGTGELFVNITDITANIWDVQVKQGALSLQTNENYTIIFSAYADSDRNITVALGLDESPYTNYASMDFDITTIKTEYTFTFNMSSPGTLNAALQFNLGISTTNVYLDDVSLYSWAELPETAPHLEDELISNGDFSDGWSGWGDGVWSGANATYNVVGGELFINISDDDHLEYEVQISQKPIPLREGITYNCSFYIRGDENRTIKVLLVQDVTYTSYYEIEFNITSTMTLYQFDYTMINETDEAAIFQMNFGDSNVSVYLDDIGLYSPDIVDYPTTEVIIRLCNYAAWPARVHDDLSYRYFFNISEVIAEGYSIDNVTIEFDSEIDVNITGPILWSGNTYYVEIHYNNTELFPGGGGNEYKEAKLVLGLKVIENYIDAWDPTNDWSYQGLSGDYIISDYIPVYDHGLGLLLYGTTPP
ncbi:MAG: glycoside hydrolase family 9 protein [Candidatus Lokiarchaeota archaeon]|nr:glycoside hydrolase family 9 protein [Candidatus Lokiarchaeota archaeon]